MGTTRVVPGFPESSPTDSQMPVGFFAVHAAASASPSPPAPLVYEIVAVGALPTIDTSVTIKSMLFEAHTVDRLNRLLRRSRSAMVSVFFLGMACVAVGSFAHVELARPSAVVGFLCLLMPQVSYLLTLRFQFVAIIMRSFDFWYTTLVILLWTASGAVMFGDLRACLLLMMHFGMELQLVGDACIRPMPSLVATALISAGIAATFMVLASFDLIDQAVWVRLASSKGGKHVLTNQDVFINTALPLIILACRLAHSKRQALRRRDLSTRDGELREADSSASLLPAIRCMAYRTRLKLQLYDYVENSARQRRRAGTELQLSSLLPLRAVRIHDRIYSGDTVLRPLYPCLPLRVQHRILLRLAGLVGLTASILAFQKPNGDRKLVQTSIALACTSLYCGFHVGVSQRCLLGRLFRSFDFVFVLVQFTLALVGVAGLFRWNSVVLLGGVLPCWLWMWHFLTLDALTPVVRQRIGLNVHLGMAPLAVFFMVGQLYIFIEILFLDNWKLEDLTLLHIKVGSRSLRLRAVTFILGRVVSTFMWSGRILWRLRPTDQGGGEGALLLLMGAVEFDQIHRDARASARAAAQLASKPP